MSGPKRGIALLFASNFLCGLCFYGPVATLYRQSAGLNLLDMAIIESVFVGLLLLLEVPWGYLADRLGHRRTIILCAFLLALSKIIFWQADTFFGFLLERVVLAVAGAGLSGCDSAYLFSLCGEGDAQKVYGRWTAWQTAGMLAAGGASSLFLTGRYRLAALLTVLTYFGAALLMLALPKVEAAPATRPRPNIRRALGYSLGLLPLLLAAGLLAETAQFITVFLSQVQYLRSGIPEGWFGVLYAVVMVAALLGVKSHRLAGRLGEGRSMVLLFCPALISCLLMALFPTPACSVGGIVLLKLSAVLFLPLSLALQNQQAAANGVGAATQLSCNAMVMDLVSLGMNPAFGRAADLGTEKALFLGVVACGIGLILMLIFLRRKAGKGERLGAAKPRAN